MAKETYTTQGRTVYENGIELASIIEPPDLQVLEAACLSNRLEWQGYEALFEDGKWIMYLQKSTGLKRIGTVPTLSRAWLYVNGWTE